MIITEGNSFEGGGLTVLSLVSWCFLDGFMNLLILVLRRNSRRDVFKCTVRCKNVMDFFI